jgi:hypothetical protein
MKAYRNIPADASVRFGQGAGTYYNQIAAQFVELMGASFQLQQR